MTWRYGLTVQKLSGGEDWYEVREIYSDEQGRWNSWTESSIAASSDSREGAIKVLELMLKDCKEFKAKRIPSAPTNDTESMGGGAE